MPRPRFLALPPERRRHILDVAARHFAAEGFAGASLNRILAEAGVSKGAAYYYFDDKGDLFATVVEEAWEALVRELWPDGFDPERLAGAAFWPELERIYRRQVALFVERPHVWRVVKATPRALDDRSVARLGPKVASLVAALDARLAEAQSAGHVRDDLPRGLLLAMLGAVDDAVDTWFLERPDALAHDPDLSARTFATLRRLLEPPPSRSPSAQE